MPGSAVRWKLGKEPTGSHCSSLFPSLLAQARQKETAYDNWIAEMMQAQQLAESQQAGPDPAAEPTARCLSLTCEALSMTCSKACFIPIRLSSWALCLSFGRIGRFGKRRKVASFQSLFTTLQCFRIKKSLLFACCRKPEWHDRWIGKGVCTVKTQWLATGFRKYRLLGVWNSLCRLFCAKRRKMHDRSL